MAGLLPSKRSGQPEAQRILWFPCNHNASHVWDPDHAHFMDKKFLSTAKAQEMEGYLIWLHSNYFGFKVHKLFKGNARLLPFREKDNVHHEEGPKDTVVGSYSVSSNKPGENLYRAICDVYSGKGMGEMLHAGYRHHKMAILMVAYRLLLAQLFIIRYHSGEDSYLEPEGWSKYGLKGVPAKWTENRWLEWLPGYSPLVDAVMAAIAFNNPGLNNMAACVNTIWHEAHEHRAIHKRLPYIGSYDPQYDTSDFKARLIEIGKCADHIGMSVYANQILQTAEKYAIHGDIHVQSPKVKEFAENALRTECREMRARLESTYYNGDLPANRLGLDR